MRPQIGQFLQYLRVERGASPHTLKGYREDLHALAEYLADGDGQCPAPGSITMGELRGFRFRAARSRLREVVDLAAAGVGAQLHAIRPARRLGQIEPGQGAAQPAQEPQAAALSFDRRSRQAARRAEGQHAAGGSRPGDSGNAVLGRPARERARRPQRRRPRFRGRHRPQSAARANANGWPRSAPTRPAR